jgi:hypothetical protein
MNLSWHHEGHEGHEENGGVALRELRALRGESPGGSWKADVDVPEVHEPIEVPVTTEHDRLAKGFNTLVLELLDDANEAETTFVRPGRNSVGDRDWVPVLQAEASHPTPAIRQPQPTTRGLVGATQAVARHWSGPGHDHKASRIRKNSPPARRGTIQVLVSV